MMPSRLLRVGGTVLLLLMASFVQAQSFSVLYTFTGGNDGAYPHGSLLRDGQGNLYGTALNGGALGNGTVFKLDGSGAETVLHSFGGAPDGQYPTSGLVRDSKGNLYGITENGGTGNGGSAYKLTLQGKESIIHSFGFSNDGVFPVAPFVRDSSGNLYGTAQAGGAFGYGMVFRLSATGAEAVLHNFDQSKGDGSAPVAGLIRDDSGNLYGTTFGGGAFGEGTVFEIDRTGVETVLYSFGKKTGDGANPQGPVLRDSAGNFYGTTNGGGSSNFGTVFKLDAKGHEIILHSFGGGIDGANPAAGLTRDSAGNLYGVTTFGGTRNYGVLFKIDARGSESILHTFTGQSDGGNPQVALLRDAAGNLYGVASGGVGGGPAQFGTVFNLIP
jgi:uncharacterized repeat protein (TIGR03803 family)